MCLPTVELRSHDETNTAEIIDQMFEEVLEYAGRMQGEGVEDEDTEDHDSGIGVCPGDKDKMDMESEREKSEEEHESNCDELLTFPPSGILSPLSKSVEAVVTPLVRLVYISSLSCLYISSIMELSRISRESYKFRSSVDLYNVLHPTNSDWR